MNPLSFCLLVVAAFACVSADKEAGCKTPTWHKENKQMGENWPQPGIFKKSKPLYALAVKGLNRDKTFGPSTKLRVSLSSVGKGKSHYMSGFMINLENTTDCDAGTFKSRGKKIGQPLASPECPTMVALEKTDKMIRRTAVRWNAPSCGCVTVRATILGNDDRIYYDDEDEVAEEHRRLVKTFCATEPDQ